MTPQLRHNFTVLPNALIALLLCLLPGFSAQLPPDLSGDWTLRDAKAPAAVYRMRQSEKEISIEVGGSGQVTRFPLDGTEPVITMRSGRKARLSGCWLPGGCTLELKLVSLSQDGATPLSTYTEQHTMAADGASITERRIFEDGRGRREDTRVFVRVTKEMALAPSISSASDLPIGEAAPEEPDQPLRRYLYLAMRDSSILPPLAMGSRDPHGIIVLDLDHGLRFVKRIGSEVLHQGRATVSSGPGVRWMHGSAVTDRLYYGYSEPGAKYLGGIRPATPPPADANALIGCLDLRTDETLWEQPTRNACSIAVFPDGSRLLAVPDQSQAAHGKMTLLDAATGRILEEIPSQSRVAYGVNVMPDGRHLLPNAWGGTLTAFDTQSGREVTFSSLFPQLDTLDWSAVPERFRRFDSLDVATHYSVNGAGDFLWSQIRGISRRTRVADPLHGNLICLDLRGGRAGIAPLEPALLHQTVDPDRSRYHQWNAWDDTSIQLFGIGYVAALSPDERWLYHGTYAGDFAALVWDRAVWSPRLAGVIGAGLASETETDAISGEPVGVRCKSGAWLSADGRILFTSDSWCFDTRTWKPIGLMRNDRGEIIRCAKMNEVHFHGKDCVYFGQRFGYGRYREPSTIFPPPTDKTPPTAANQLAATVSNPAARWSGGEVVVSVVLRWKPASDDEGVQRYAVYRNGEFIGNRLGHNPGDPVLSGADAAVYRAQLGEEKPDTFTVRYLKPGQTYRLEIEPVDFAQNHGPRTRLDVAVPPVPAADEDAIVQAWAAHIGKRSQEAPEAETRQHCREALTTWLSKTHAHRPWVAAFLEELKASKPSKP